MSLSGEYELSLLKQGYDFIIGVDEVGRGSLAGPLIVCAYVFSSDTIIHEGVNDSKQLTRKKRESLSPILSLHHHAIGMSSVDEINKYKLTKSVTQAIHKALKKLHLQGKGKLLLDGSIYGSYPFDTEVIIRGDATHYSIAAASIVAKIHRDAIMRTYAKRFPHYGFETNVGYATKFHRYAIQNHGVCEIHRINFKTVRESLEQYGVIDTV